VTAATVRDIRPNAKSSTGLLVKRIQTLGGLAVFDGSRPLGGNAQQPRRLAILAVLARAGERGVSRDRLAALLWGDVEEERARRSLNQALYALRQELGTEDAILGTRDLRLNPELIEVDLAAFETARASGAFEEAVRLYAGPFLGDFHLAGVPAFARWAEAEREGIAAGYRDLVEAAAAAATAREDRGAAVLWWRRLAALDPTDTPAAQGLMRALAAAGDMPGALRHAEIVRQVRQDELELPPDPAVEELAERIRAGEGVAAAVYASGGPGAAGTATGASPPQAGGRTEPTSTAAAAAEAAPAESPRPSSAGSGPVVPAGAAAAVPAPTRRRTTWALLAAVGVAALVVAALLLRPAGPSSSESSSARRLAVLPFQNQGDSADAYFADGVTDELRGKLAAVPGLEVVASLSSNDYRGSTRTLADIARELGVNYLLVGKIRWQRGPAGTSRVRVSPELIQLAGGHPPTTRWQQPFDAALTDVFTVQADIATKVADALGVMLGDSARRQLTVKPTESLAAYDEFLKGEAASQGMKADQAGLRRAIAFYQRAVALDSTFAGAWSQLSRARTSLYSNGVPDQTLADAARAAAERARALRPDDPQAYLASGDYYSSINPIDNDRAAAEYEHGLRLAPDDVELLSAVATTGARLQQWDGILARLNRARQLDPRSPTVARRLATVNVFLRRYDAADSAADRAIALAPTSPQMVLMKVLVALGRGDLAGARAVARTGAERIDPTTILAFLATYQDLYWVLDSAQQRQVLALPPDAFDGDRAVWGLVRTEIHHLQGDLPRARIYADSARLALVAQSAAAPDDGQRHVLLGLALAYLGRKAEAVREGRRGVELLPLDRDAFLGPYVQLQLVRIYLLTGEPDQALDQLEPLLRMPFYLSPGWLRLDPTFGPVRPTERFRRLIAGPPEPGPDSTRTTGPQTPPPS
jgi:DNA-binding SARP family transcriptional activator/TolB-like protein/Tfp pilus assembly protein PilF